MFTGYFFVDAAESCVGHRARCGRGAGVKGARLRWNSERGPAARLSLPKSALLASKTSVWDMTPPQLPLHPYDKIELERLELSRATDAC